MKNDQLIEDLINCEIEIRRLQEISRSIRERLQSNNNVTPKRKLSPEGLKAIQKATKAMWARKRRAAKSGSKKQLSPAQLKAMRANAVKARQKFLENRGVA